MGLLVVRSFPGVFAELLSSRAANMRVLLLLAAVSSEVALFKPSGAAKPRPVVSQGKSASFFGNVVPVAPPADPEPEAELVNTVVDLSITALRLTTCSMMYHHGIDKIQNVDGFSANVVAKFFGFLPGDPHFWTYAAAATQVAGSGLLAVGVLARPVALSMLGTM